jgi:hypothetical protein
LAVFIFRYVDNCLGEVRDVKLDSFSCDLWGFSAYFCFACGRFMGFEKHSEVCWVCEPEFEIDDQPCDLEEQTL